MNKHISKDTHTAKIVDAARELLKSFGYFVDKLWHVDDVHFICEQHNLPKITNEEALEVFVIASDHFDGETGISWPQLEAALRMYMEREMVLRNPREKDPV